MPHDKNGALIQKGDRVTIEFDVKDVYSAENYCNAQLESVEPMPTDDGPGAKLTLSAVNTRQCVKVG